MVFVGLFAVVVAGIPTVFIGLNLILINFASFLFPSFWD